MSGLCFIDIETTGLDPTRHAVWEIAIITDSGEYEWILQLTDDQIAVAEPMALTVGDFYRRYHEGFAQYIDRVRYAPINSAVKATEYRGLIRDRHYISVADRSTLADFLVKEIDTSHLVGAVPNFDARFVGDFCREHKRVPAWHYHLVDIEALAAGKLGWQPPWKSKDLYRALGVNPNHFAEHTALGDARMAKAVYEVVFGLEPSYPEALDSVDEEKEEPPVPDGATRIVPLLDEEAENSLQETT